MFCTYSLSPTHFLSSVINTTLTEGREAVARIHGKVECRRLKDERKKHRQKHTHTHDGTEHDTVGQCLPFFIEMFLHNVFSFVVFHKSFDSGSTRSCWRTMTSSWESCVCFCLLFARSRLTRLRWTTVGKGPTRSKLAIWTADPMVGTTRTFFALTNHPSVITHLASSVVYCRFYSDQYSGVATGPQQPEELRSILSQQQVWLSRIMA